MSVCNPWTSLPGRTMSIRRRGWLKVPDPLVEQTTMDIIDEARRIWESGKWVCQVTWKGEDPDETTSELILCDGPYPLMGEILGSMPSDFEIQPGTLLTVHVIVDSNGKTEADRRDEARPGS
jgi:hypothetical protein